MLIRSIIVILFIFLPYPIGLLVNRKHSYAGYGFSFNWFMGFVAILVIVAVVWILYLIYQFITGNIS